MLACSELQARSALSTPTTSAAAPPPCAIRRRGGALRVNRVLLRQEVATPSRGALLSRSAPSGTLSTQPLRVNDAPGTTFAPFAPTSAAWMMQQVHRRVQPQRRSRYTKCSDEHFSQWRYSTAAGAPNAMTLALSAPNAPSAGTSSAAAPNKE